MTEKNIFYVYEHWRPDNDVCFYVGKGKGKRAWSMGGRSKWHTAVVSKLTSLGMCVDVRIVARDLAEDTAFALERDRIVFYGRARLVNLTPGGEGKTGYIPSAETRAKQSAVRKGRKLTPEHRAKIGAFFRGKKLSKEHVEKVRAAHAGKAPAAKTILAAAEKNRGKKRSRTAIEKQIAARAGVALTAEHRAAISKGQQGKILSAEHRNKLRLAWTRRAPASEETNRKIAEAVRHSWARRKAVVK